MIASKLGQVMKKICTVNRSYFFQARTIRRELDAPPKTLQNRDKVRPGTGREGSLGCVLDERTGMYS